MVLELKIQLDGTEPRVWRRVKLNASGSFHEFHLVLQAAFGWGNYHFYQFSKNGWRSHPVISEKTDDDFKEYDYSDRSEWPSGKYFDSRSILLSDYFSNGTKKITYIYDFGDNWGHIITLGSTTDENLLVPLCTGGEGKCLPEDCGGPGGYYDMVEIANSARHPERTEIRKWLGLKKGQSWDLNVFDLEATNQEIRELWEVREEW